MCFFPKAIASSSSRCTSTLVRLRQQLGRGSQIAVSPSFHGELMVDWNLLWHAISNALSNARKYGDKASIEVRLNYQPPDLVVTVVNSADAREQARLMAKHGQDATGLLQRRIEGGTALSSNLGSRAILQAAALHGGRATRTTTCIQSMPDDEVVKWIDLAT